MWYLFLDESGDLGFDFVNKKPSDFFTIYLLATSDPNSYRTIRRAIKTTLRRKVNKNKPPNKRQTELKGSVSSFAVKKYFFDKIISCRFGLYAITINKRESLWQLVYDKPRVYNYIAREILEKIPFHLASDRVQLVVDKSKGKHEIIEFNNYITQQLQGKLNPNIPLNIDHLTGQEELALQVADLFAWGIFRKYESKDTTWFDYFKGKLIYEKVIL